MSSLSAWEHAMKSMDTLFGCSCYFRGKFPMMNQSSLEVEPNAEDGMKFHFGSS